MSAALQSSECTPVLLTDYVRNVELSDLSREVEPLVKKGKVVCHRVANSDEHYRRLRKGGVHKGEASAIAWLLGTKKQKRIVFVTRDNNAAKAAIRERVPCTDVLGLVVDLMKLAALLEDEASFALSIWDDKSQQVCRPTDWTGFTQSVARREALDFPYFRA